jgi:hypothetical protein
MAEDRDLVAEARSEVEVPVDHPMVCEMVVAVRLEVAGPADHLMACATVVAVRLVVAARLADPSAAAALPRVVVARLEVVARWADRTERWQEWTLLRRREFPSRPESVPPCCHLTV